MRHPPLRRRVKPGYITSAMAQHQAFQHPERDTMHGPERWPLGMIWNPAVTNHDTGRAQGCTAALDGILKQVELNRRD